jgi:cyclopropane fatty-acyl-phospholipid synthase-like methyltransferase
MPALESRHHSAAGTSPFSEYSLGRLVKQPIYSLKTFYEVKNTVIRYDDRTDYVNLGYWDNDDTSNPSARLVEETAAKLNLTSDDILLNIGSGLGQPDVDIVNQFSPKRIIGVNLSSAQVTYANAKFRALNLANRVEHRVADARHLNGDLAREGVTSVISVEALAEIPEVAAIIHNCYNLLPPGGRISFCDGISADKVKIGWLKKLTGRLLLKFVTIIYDDHWRPATDYLTMLEQSGFTNIRGESIGHKVFQPLYRHAKTRFPLLRQKKLPLVMRLITYLNFGSMNILYAWGQLDYMIFYAEKRNQ